MRRHRSGPVLQDATVRTLTLTGAKGDGMDRMLTLDELRGFVATVQEAGGVADTPVEIVFGALRVQLPQGR
jgi:hypothetical protein